MYWLVVFCLSSRGNYSGQYVPLVCLWSKCIFPWKRANFSRILKSWQWMFTDTSIQQDSEPKYVLIIYISLSLVNPIKTNALSCNVYCLTWFVADQLSEWNTYFSYVILICFLNSNYFFSIQFGLSLQVYRLYSRSCFICILSIN